ncbi:hypothetical protein QYF50_26305 [Paenibacillus vini]|uniref:hypothetical protein n=1 Tax=Paenibacillus vini TaxID=1476024 RepID=UPI0025B6C398|nr:hypothetical protein [Paenibacillus vini]MDN4071407.1 hypothetical protein [Paenibacillus vini]
MILKKWTIGLIAAALLLVMPVQAAQAQTKLYKEKVLEVDDRVSNHKRGGLAFNGNFYLYFDPYGELYKSVDGLKWDFQEAYTIIKGVQYDGTGGNVRKLIFDGARFIVLYDTYFAVSQDGLHWERSEIPFPNNNKKEYTFEDVIYSGGNYYFLAQDRDKNVDGFYFPGPNHILISGDLQSFKPAQFKKIENSIAGERPLDSLVTNGKVFLATGNTSAVSKDGKVWTGDKANLLGGYNGVWDGKQFLFAHMNMIFSTQDGSKTTNVFTFKEAQWSPKTKQYSGGLPLRLDVIGYNGKEYLAGGSHFDWMSKGRANEDTVLIYSKDGKTWEKIYFPGGGTDFDAIYPTSFGFLLTGNNVWAVSTKPFEKTPVVKEFDSQAAKSQENAASK